MVGILVDVMKEIVGYIKDKNEIHEQTVLRVSEILSEISNTLSDTAYKLKNNEYPHGNCVVIQRLSDNLKFQLSEFITMEDIDRLHNSLREASEVERLYALKEMPDTIPSIERAAGEFKSMSILMRI